MSTISALPAQIVRWLSDQSALSDITFLTEYPAIKKAVPLRKVIVAIGLGSVTLTDQFKDDGNGVLERQEYCRSAAMQIRLAIHVPFSHGGHTCHEVFSKVADALNFASNLHIEESGCDSITEDRDTDALVLKGYLKITAEFCPAISSDLYFQSFFDKELLCGTHIRDTTIHMSAEERANWNHPLATSLYTGNGQGSRSFTLDYEPAWICVYACEFPPVLMDTENQRIESYCGWASKYGSSAGVKLEGKTLRLYNDQTLVPGSITKLNQAGYRYCIAISR